jgi:hypothetical protein
VGGRNRAAVGRSGIRGRAPASGARRSEALGWGTVGEAVRGVLAVSCTGGRTRVRWSTIVEGRGWNPFLPKTTHHSFLCNHRKAGRSPRGGTLTRNGRILPSFGNWIAVFADRSSRQGIRCRMPDFHPPSISEFQSLIVWSQTWRFVAVPGWGCRPTLGPGWESPGRVGNSSMGAQESAR